MGFMARMATAPISWGICEVPGWGVQLSVDRVLAEMADLGFTATELGSDGWLPTDGTALMDTLANHNLTLLAAFVPLVIHEPAELDKTLSEARDMAALLQSCGAKYFNSAPVTSWDWGPRSELTAEQWAHSVATLDEVEQIVTDHGLTQVLHSHVGTIVETADEVQRVLDNSAVKFVLDTAHLAVGGYDPVDFVANHADRVGLAHIKDADLGLAARLNAGEMTLMEAVQAGIFPVVGRGDLDLDTVIESLEGAGYDDWYVLEQDIAITGNEPPAGHGPIESVQDSLDYLRTLETRLAA